MTEDDQLAALERLAKLKESGMLTEEEFASRKLAILSKTNTTHVVFYRRLWFVILLTFLLVTFPVAMIILLTGDVYRKRKSERFPINRVFRFVYGGLLGLWLIALIVTGAFNPATLKQRWADSASSDSTPGQDSKLKPSASAQEQSSPVTAPSQSGGPDIQISQQDTQYGPSLVVTDNDDKPFTIKRIVLNNRENTAGCDLPEHPAMGSMQVFDTQLPKDMNRGDQAVLYSACGAATVITVYTNLGVMKLEQSQ